MIHPKPTAATKRVHNWKDRVYSEKHGVFESPYEFQFFVEQEVAMDPFFEKPDYVWAAKVVPSVRIDPKDVDYLLSIQQATPTRKSLKALRAAVEQFNIANARVAYGPDHSTIIPLEWAIQSPKKPKPPAEPSEIVY